MGSNPTSPTLNAVPDPAPAPRPVQGPSRLLIIVLCVSGVLTVLAGIALGIAVKPVLFAIAAAGIVDFVMAWLFASGRVGPDAQRRREAEAAGDPTAIAEVDPTYNPYARED